RDTPLEDIGFDPDPDAVAHATLTLPHGVIAGGDSMDSENDYPIRGTAYSLLYTTETPEEAEQFIEKLRSGGSIGMPFQKAPWGDWYGQVFDRFGVMWAFSCEASSANPIQEDRRAISSRIIALNGASSVAVGSSTLLSLT